MLSPITRACSRQAAQSRPSNGHSPHPDRSFCADELRRWGVQAICDEARGLELLAQSINESFAAAALTVLQCTGRTVVVGIGKSGHIGRKIAATLASTGSPALFVHPAEASHGDLGMIERRDVVLAISKSGESPELGDVLAYCRRFGIPVIAITAVADSSLGKAARHVLLLPNPAEACPMGLVPTTSTTMALALGDALAIACLKGRDFQPAQFREFHPGGKLGQKLTRVRDVMHSGDLLPTVKTTALVSDAVLEMSRGRLGCVGVVDQSGSLVGIFTDGDLRRHFSAVNIDKPITEFMHTSPQRVSPDALVADVVHLFTEKRIPSVFVCVDEKPLGIVHVHDVLQKGFI
jgi:arabinose-5-phosphate isomerase